MPKKKEKFRCGFVSILGRPNAGKSTLLNAFLGTKLAIVADKPQTTRTSIQGVVHLPKAQVIFLDTPGIHKSDTPINRRMMNTVRMASEGRDLLLYVVDATLPVNNQEEQALGVVKKAETPTMLVLNKVDAVKDKNQLLPRIEQYQRLSEFVEYVPVSALTGEGIERLRDLVVSRLPVAAPMYPPDYFTDQPERFWASELIREKVLHHTKQEVPHAVAVLIDQWEETGKLTRIAATVYVERDGQKAIIIGSQGSMLKRIGTEARLEMESLLDRKVFLELFVKVKADWRQNPEFLNEIDWRAMAGAEEA